MSDSTYSSDSYESTGPIESSSWRTYIPSSSSDDDNDCEDVIRQFPTTPMNVKEKQSVLKFLENGKLETNMLPEATNTYIREHKPQIWHRLATLTAQDQGWMLLTKSLIFDINQMNRTTLPKNVLFDVYVFSPSKPIFILTITNRDTPYTHIYKYNSALVNSFLSRLQDSNIDIQVMCGVIAEANCHTEAAFIKRLDEVEADARITALPGTLDMHPERFKMVTRIFLDLISRGQTSVEIEFDELKLENTGLTGYEKVSKWMSGSMDRSDTVYGSHLAMGGMDMLGSTIRTQNEMSSFNDIGVVQVDRREHKVMMSTYPKSDTRSESGYVGVVQVDRREHKVMMSTYPKSDTRSESGYESASIQESLNEETEAVMNEKNGPFEILLQASQDGELETVKQICTNHRVDVDRRGRNGITAIALASFNGHRAVFEFLQSIEADITVLDDNKHTILHHACINDNVEFVKYLLSLNIADINVRGEWGGTPIMFAAHSGCRKVFDLLKTEGADITELDDNKNTILHVACSNDNVEFVKYLLSLNIADINVRGQSGRTPIMVAAQYGCRKVFDLLKTEGADITVLDDNKNTILHYACSNDNVEFVKYLLSLNIADINVRGQWDRTLIMCAAQYGCRKVFDLLKTEGADTTVLDDNKNTILHYACFNDNVEFVKYLLSLNIADINVRGQSGRTPIMVATESGCRKVFDLLKTEGADITVLDDNKNTILHYACSNDNVEFVKYLLSLNIADINIRGEWGGTPIMFAAHSGCRKVFDLLKTEGADITELDDNKNTILHYACSNDNVEFVKYLLSLNIADINVRGRWGTTLIMCAALYGCRKVFDLLKTEGADTTVLDDNKNTILHVACFNDNVEFVKYLLSLNIADINVRGQWGRTSIMFAAQYGCRKVFGLLKAKGADITVLNDIKDTILLVACVNDNVEFVKYLLSLNIADINVRGQLGTTLILFAAQYGCRKVFDLLKTEGADTTVLDDNKNTILHYACFNDNVEFVKYLLSLNIADINVRGQLGRTPIMFVAESGCRKVFDLLKAEGADITVLDYNKNTILHVACSNDNVEFVKYLLSLNIADINVRGQWGRTPIMVAAQYGCRKVFDLLKTEGADINILVDNKNTILHVACFKDNVEFVKYLLSLNIADINVRGQWGGTPIMFAALYGCRTVFDLLKTEGADITVLDDNKNTILHVACIKDNVELVKYLLSLNIADINVRGQFGRTLIMCAAQYGCRKVFDLLKTEGADITVLDDNKNTILHVACSNDNVEFVKYLLSLNIADINVRGQWGRTLIMCAAQYGCRKVFDLLKTEGADITLLDDNKNTILHVACSNDNVEFVKYLLSLNIADINVRGQLGRTLIMCAAQYGCRKVFDLLKTEGADITLLDDNKNTILHVACFKNNVEFVKYLLSLNIADINVRGQLGTPPIMYAALYGCRKVFDLLKAEGADITVLDDNKKTILHVACSNDNIEFVKYLLILNIADINVRGQWGRTPIMVAAQAGSRKVLDLLKAEGADITVLNDEIY